MAQADSSRNSFGAEALPDMSAMRQLSSTRDLHSASRRSHHSCCHRFNVSTAKSRMPGWRALHDKEEHHQEHDGHNWGVAVYKQVDLCAAEYDCHHSYCRPANSKWASALQPALLQLTVGLDRARLGTGSLPPGPF